MKDRYEIMALINAPDLDCAAAIFVSYNLTLLAQVRNEPSEIIKTDHYGILRQSIYALNKNFFVS